MDTREDQNSELGLGSKDDINYMIWTISRCEWIICPIFDVYRVIFQIFQSEFLNPFSEIKLKSDPNFLKNLVHNENEFFEHFNFQIKNHIDDRRDLTSRMREYAGMDLAPPVVSGK